MHKAIKQGDIVLIKEPFAKPSNYPMGIVKKTVCNEMGEVTGAIVMKGKTRELLKRHSSTLIPLLMVSDDPDLDDVDQKPGCSGDLTNERSDTDQVALNRPRRQAAIDSEQRTSAVFKDEVD